MSSAGLGVVVWWIKKDARVADNECLQLALQTSLAQNKTLLAIYLREPQRLRELDFCQRREMFVMQGLKDLKTNLANFSVPLFICDSPALNFFDVLKESVQQCFSSSMFSSSVLKVFSTEETGTLWTFKRDMQLAAWFKLKGLEWHEVPNSGIIRGLGRRNSRKTWPNLYKLRMERSNFDCQILLEAYKKRESSLPKSENLNINVPFVAQGITVKLREWNPLYGVQVGGETQAQTRLKEFAENKLLEKYTYSISKPFENFTNGSRLSAYISHGHLSAKFVRNFLFKFDEQNSQGLFYEPSRNVEMVTKRLVWRDHFIQKLEFYPEMELHERNLDAAQVRNAWNSKLEHIWKNSETGFPFVDACLRAVHATGYLNFRARASLMSFATHLMWMDWRFPAWDLAKAFLDYEPGIHFSQVQMQASLTGVHVIRIYSPSKQSRECDKFAKFIKLWIPELRKCSVEDIHNIQNLPPSYPKPLFVEAEAMHFAREKLYKRNTI